MVAYANMVLACPSKLGHAILGPSGSFLGCLQWQQWTKLVGGFSGSWDVNVAWTTVVEVARQSSASQVIHVGVGNGCGRLHRPVCKPSSGTFREIPTMMVTAGWAQSQGPGEKTMLWCRWQTELESPWVLMIRLTTEGLVGPGSADLFSSFLVVHASTGCSMWGYFNLQVPRKMLKYAAALVLEKGGGCFRWQ